MKSYIEIDFTEKNKPHKRFTQTLLYKSSKVKGNSLLLCGPNLKSHIKDAKLISTGSNTNINIYETHYDTYLKNVKDKKKIKNPAPINIFNEDILQAFKTKKCYRFIDLDFCNILDDYNINIIKKAFYYMNNLENRSKNLNKHILITFCRRDKRQNINNIQVLCDLFNIKNDFIRDNFLAKIDLNKSKSSNACYINYCDGAPMCTFSYQFK